MVHCPGFLQELFLSTLGYYMDITTDRMKHSVCQANFRKSCVKFSRDLNLWFLQVKQFSIV
jgi:hypothetical protein